MNARRVPLGSVAQFINGAAFKPEDWGDEGARIIRIQNLTDSSKPFNRTKKHVPEHLQVRPGELLVSWSATLGVFEWAGPDIGVLNQHIFRVIPDLGKVDKPYFSYVLARALDDMQRHLHGATMQHVNRGAFLATPVYLPGLPEQRRIAAILDKAEELRAKRRAAIAQLDTLAQSIFLEMFGDPATNPKGWPQSALTTLCSSSDDIRCGPFGTQLAKPEYRDRGVPLWGIRNVNAGFALPTHEFLEPATADRLHQYSIQSGDIVMTRKGTIGNCAVYPVAYPPGVMHSDLLRLRLNGSVADSTFVSHQLQHSREVERQVALISGGAVMPGINVGKLKQIVVLVPPLSEQAVFAQRVAAADRPRDLQHRALAKLNTLFASLQHRAFRGEL